ncbi:putative Ras-related protein Rab-33 [Actinia tenebrosa]|uniref:Ras-related protein Rab-33 n=1 Tax=Actinia tenebrosa TaxID=6105 RepID=A0A6P8H0U7_ACTTE|nr:putative Ras-related protein Rab-33 [Actinia tenebrosa]
MKSSFYDREDEVLDNEESKPPITEKTFKIIIIGDSNVGKTCLAHRFCTGRFPNRTETTIGVDFWEKQIQIGSDTVKMQLWDTAGQERFRKSMVSHYYRNVSAVVFMYDITRKSSFEGMSNWLYEYGQFSEAPDVPRILIGNKCDLGNLRTVNSNEARKFADSYNMPLWEISTKNNEELETIDSIFLTLAHKLVKDKPIMKRGEGLAEIISADGGKTSKRHSSKKRSKRIKLQGKEKQDKKKCCESH